MLHNQSEQRYKLVAQAKQFLSILKCTCTYQCAGVIILTHVFNHNVHVIEHAKQQIILVYKLKSFVDVQKSTIFFIQHARMYALFGLACKVCNIQQAMSKQLHGMAPILIFISVQLVYKILLLQTSVCNQFNYQPTDFLY